MPKIDLSDAAAKALASLAPVRRQPGQSAEQAALDEVLESERLRQGGRDPVSGAYHRLALMQGTLVKEEYDLSTHGHLPAWPVGIVTADLRETILFNQRYGFAVGDQLLRAIATELERLFPRAKVVRTHVDAFAALLLPSSELTVSLEMKARAETALAEAVRRVLPDDGQPPPNVQVTVALVHLEIVQPSHWQELGPLLWAEAERAHVIERLGRAPEGIQRRRIVLDAAV